MAAALAVSVLLAPAGLSSTAHADGRKGLAGPERAVSAHPGDGLYFSIDHDRYRHGHGHGGRHDHDRHRREHARYVRETCRAAIRREANYIGFRDVDFDSRGRIEQTGPRRFYVRFHEVEFEGRRREFERSVGCEFVRGKPVFIDGIPRPGGHGRHGHRTYGY